MTPTLTSFVLITFLTSSMSYQTLEWLALALFLIILVVLSVGLMSTSTSEEAEAPIAASLEPRSAPLEFMTAVGLWSTSTIGQTYTGTVNVEVVELDKEALVLRSIT
jgi:cell division protein FtsW (lipid II flippase)